MRPKVGAGPRIIFRGSKVERSGLRAANQERDAFRIGQLIADYSEWTMGSGRFDRVVILCRRYGRRKGNSNDTGHDIGENDASRAHPTTKQHGHMGNSLKLFGRNGADKFCNFLSRKAHHIS